MKKIKKEASIPSSEFSDTFVQGMYNRMAMSFHKYGKVAKGFPEHVDAIETLKLHIKQFEEDGNTTWLIDVANYAMIEFMRPRHPKAHFNPDAPKQSIGRKKVGGVVSQRPNDLI